MGRICKRAGVKPFGFHAVRHLTASILYKKGYEVAIIQAILRHKGPNTTEKYLKTLGLEGVRKALEDLTPKKGKIVDFMPGLVEGEKSSSGKKKPSEEPSTPQTARPKLRAVK